MAYFDPQKREFYWARPTQIDAPTTVDVPPLPLYAAPPAAAPSEDIEALRRENERLQNLLYDQMGKVFASRAAEQMRKQIAELKHAENERLKADNERLRGLLAEAQKAVWMNYDGDLLDRIEAALKEVPR